MVQGASRGIGLEFVKQLLEKNEKGHVVAACRNPNVASGLLHLKNRFAERLSILPLDLTIENTIEASAKSIRERFGSLNLLINVSGILSIPVVLQPAMWPLLKVGGGSGTERDVAVVANLSARVGSIGDNHLGGWHSYGSSKTAFNQLTKTVSVEFARKKDPIICILLHPGTVDTDLSRPFQRNVPEGKLFTKEFSVQNLLGIINNAKSHDNGKFFAWDGQEIPWDREGSVHTVHTGGSHSRGGSRFPHEDDAEAMQKEIDHLKKKLCHARQRLTPSLSDPSSKGSQGSSYRPRSRTPPSETFSYEKVDLHGRRDKSLPPRAWKTML
ncbi:hypothetical protein ACB094_11G041400 [Castanea mollissima]